MRGTNCLVGRAFPATVVTEVIPSSPKTTVIGGSSVEQRPGLCHMIFGCSTRGGDFFGRGDRSSRRLKRSTHHRIRRRAEYQSTKQQWDWGTIAVPLADLRDQLAGIGQRLIRQEGRLVPYAGRHAKGRGYEYTVCLQREGVCARWRVICVMEHGRRTSWRRRQNRIEPT